MKVYINREPKYGPWGGGAKTVNALWRELQNNGHEVVSNLSAGIDVIFCFDPRPNQYGDWYQTFIDYCQLNTSTKLIQRVGDLGTHSKPELTRLVKQTLNISDYFIFPSQWSKEWIGFVGDNAVIIDNAPMPLFYNHRSENNKLENSVSVVTHHWSTNPKKGFNLYSKFDEWCKGENVTFNYIGQLPQGIKYDNHTRPVSAETLSQELPKHQIYLTASEEEAGANHVLEAMACGLPVVYKQDGGSIVDYCSPYGEGYSDFDGMICGLKKIIDNYSLYKDSVMKYNDTNLNVVREYIKIIEEAVNES